MVGIVNESELLRLRDTAERSGVPTSLVQDAGKTVLLPGTVTRLGSERPRSISWPPSPVG